MSAAHTEGRMDVSANIIRTAGGLGAIADTPEIARRLTACWNAFEGMTTNDIEMIQRRGGVVAALVVSAHARISDGKEIAAAHALLAEVSETQMLRGDLDERIAAFLKGGAA